VPAIQPARLKIQSTQLAAAAQQPAAFVRGLHNLLDFYADRTYRPGQVGELPTLVRAYNTPPPVLRQLIQELTPLALSDPPAALALCQALWAEPYLEFRQLAAALLGQTLFDSPASIQTVVQAWVETAPEDRLLNVVLTQGLARLRQEATESYLALIQNWLPDTDTTTPGSVYSRHVGLLALLSLVRDPDFENLPALFRVLSPFLRIAPTALRPDLLAVLSALARRSPRELAYVLRQGLTAPDNPDTAWLIRQVLPDLPADLRAGLRAALKETAV
jgi:hypothetical protein